MKQRTLLLIIAAVLIVVVLIGVVIISRKNSSSTTTTTNDGDAKKTTKNFEHRDDYIREKRSLKYDFDAEDDQPHSSDTDGVIQDTLNETERESAVSVSKAINYKKLETNIFRFEEPIKNMLMGIIVKGKHKTTSKVKFFDIEGNSYLQLELNPKMNAVKANWVENEAVLSKNWPNIWFISINNGQVSFNSNIVYELPTFFPAIHYMKLETSSQIVKVYMASINNRNINPTSAVSENYKIKQLDNVSD